MILAAAHDLVIFDLDGVVYLAGAVNVPVGATSTPGSQQLRDGPPCATCSTGPTSPAAGGWSATTDPGSRRPSSPSS